MWDDARRTGGSGAGSGGEDLLRQAYLLTGDPVRAELLARRAMAAAAQHARRTGPAGSDDVARAELVRAFVAEAGPGGHTNEPLPPGRHAAAWSAFGGLPARRRAVLVLRYSEGLSDEQIANRMGSTPRSVLADIEAGLLTLGPTLSAVPEPGRMLSAVLAQAALRWASGGYLGPAARPVPARELSVPPAAERVVSWTSVPSGAASGTDGAGDGRDWWVRGTDPDASPNRWNAGSGGQPQDRLPRRSRPAGSPPVWPAAAGATPAGPDPSDAVPAGSASAGTAGSGSAPAGPAPSGMARSGMTPFGAAPSGSARSGTAPTGTAPTGTAPTGAAPFGTAPTGTAPGPVPSRSDRPAGTDEPFAAAAFPLHRPRPRRQLRAPAVLAAAALTALVLGTVAVVVPALLDNAQSTPSGPPVAAGVTSQAAAALPTVPTLSVPKGLLDWPARGPLGNDTQVLTAATAAWKAKAPAAEAPTTAISMLYAGELDGRHVALVQALDKSGKPRVAQLSGYAPTAYRLVHSEPLMGMAELLAFLPKDGRGGRLRVLVSPEGQAADGLLASDVSKVPLRKVPLNSDGVSDILPSPPGIPTCSRVVLMGLPAPLGRTGPRVLESGVVSADMLEAMMMEVEVGSSTLAGGDNAVPQTVWFTDGELLAKKAHLGKAMVTVAALGPRLAPQPLSGQDRRTVESRAYELRVGSRKFVGSVVTFSGKTICTTVSQVGPGQQAALTAFALRCPVPSGSAGLLHIVGGPDVQSVQVILDPTRSPPGQVRYASSVDRPTTGATSGFATVDAVGSGFPCGPGSVQATGPVGTSQPMRLPVFTP
jgi:hypothetical protein